MNAKATGEKSKVSEPTLKRLPVYLNFLKQIKEGGLLTISAPRMGRELNCDPTQVVKDLAATGVTGKPRVGYNIYEVIQSIESFLGFDRDNDAFLVGAGNLGRALISYPEFRNYGLKIIAAFDNDPERIGRIDTGINVIHMDKFKDLTQRLNVQIAILTTPANVAQVVCDHLLECGIQAIWNFTPARLSVPSGIVVQNTSMYSNVAILLKKIKDRES
jgi:redox-sensing transcriptional repressor